MFAKITRFYLLTRHEPKHHLPICNCNACSLVVIHTYTFYIHIHKRTQPLPASFPIDDDRFSKILGGKNDAPKICSIFLKQVQFRFSGFEERNWSKVTQSHPWEWIVFIACTTPSLSLYLRVYESLIIAVIFTNYNYLCTGWKQRNTFSALIESVHLRWIHFDIISDDGVRFLIIYNIYYISWLSCPLILYSQLAIRCRCIILIRFIFCIKPL